MNAPRRLFLLVMWMLTAPAAVVSAQVAPDYPAPEVRIWQTGVLRADRLQHASLSLTLGASIGLATRSPAAGFGGALGFGIAKEWRDARHDRFDWLDLAADACGALAGAALTRTVMR